MSNFFVDDPLDAEKELHIRIISPKGTKKLTRVTGFKQSLFVTDECKDFEKQFMKPLCKLLKKKFGGNGNYEKDVINEKNKSVEDPIYFVQIQGDHKKEISEFLIENEFAKKEEIHIHG